MAISFAPPSIKQVPLKQYARLLTDYLKPQRRRVIWLAIALFASIALQLINPQILRYFIDAATRDAPSSALQLAALLFIGIALLTEVFAVATTYFGETVGWTATNALRTDLTTHCLHLDLSFHKSCTPGELVERVDGDVTTLARFFSRFTLYLLGNGLLLVGILTVLWFEDWRVGLSLMVFVLSALGLLTRLHTIAVPAWAAYRQLSAEFFGFLSEHLTGKEDLRANDALSYVRHRFQAILQRWLPNLPPRPAGPNTPLGQLSGSICHWQRHCSGGWGLSLVAADDYHRHRLPDFLLHQFVAPADRKHSRRIG